VVNHTIYGLIHSDKSGKSHAKRSGKNDYNIRLISVSVSCPV